MSCGIDEAVNSTTSATLYRDAAYILCTAGQVRFAPERVICRTCGRLSFGSARRIANSPKLQNGFDQPGRSGLVEGLNNLPIELVGLRQLQEDLPWHREARGLNLLALPEVLPADGDRRPRFQIVIDIGA